MKKKRTARSAFSACVSTCSALVCVVAIAAYANIITVTNINDSGPGSLRQALVDSQDGDTINFDPALNGQTILLTTAELAIAKNVTISRLGRADHPQPCQRRGRRRR